MNKSSANRQRVKKYSLIVIPDTRAKVWRWEVSRKKIEGLLAVCCTVLFIVTGSIWGFIHYRSAYIATEDVRLQNAKFEQERSELLTKLANLEVVVQRTERFASRIESSLGLNTDDLQKGIGPLMETDFAEPASVRKFDSLGFSNKDNKIAFSNLDMGMRSLGNAVTAVDERLQTVYEFNQDRLTYWASMPSIWPTKGWITSGFGRRSRPIRGGTNFHNGVDIAAPPGTPILCPGEGIVTYSGYLRGLGKAIKVDHGYGVVSIYGHNSANYVKKGDRVKRGEIIGSVGRTGLATGSHLHYQIEVDGVPTDPMSYIHHM